MGPLAPRLGSCAGRTVYDELHLRTQAIPVAGHKTLRRVDRAQCGGVALRSPAGSRVSPIRPTRPDVINYLARYGNARRTLAHRQTLLDAAVSRRASPEFASLRDYPKAIEEMETTRLGFMGHGTTNSESLAGLARTRSAKVIRHVLKTIKQPAAAAAVAGGNGPHPDLQHARHSRRRRRRLLRRLNNDDQPFP